MSIRTMRRMDNSRILSILAVLLLAGSLFMYTVWSGSGHGHGYFQLFLAIDFVILLAWAVSMLLIRKKNRLR
jgi:heme A synthase